MFRPIGGIVGLGLLAWASSAAAQPQVTATQVTPPDVAELNIQDLEEEEDVAAIRLRWTTSIASNDTFLYELSYDLPRSDQVQTVDLVDVLSQVDSDQNNGTATNGRQYQHLVRASQILKIAGTASSTVTRPAGCPEDVVCLENRTRSLIIRVFPSSDQQNPNVAGTDSFVFDVDVVAPPAPIQGVPEPGQNRLTINWDRLTPTVLSNLGRAAERINFYEVLYCVADDESGFPGYIPPTTSEPPEGDPDHLPCDNPTRIQRIGETIDSFAIEEGLRNDVPTAVAVRAVDLLRNTGPLSNVQIATPIPTTDFFELHRELGGQEEGGFCFVATAAHGSYAHPVVRVLRAFRDRVLALSPAGSAFVRAYYHYSPPWARWVAADEGRRSAARVALLPVALFSLLALAGPFVALALGLALIFGRRRARWLPPLAGLFVLLLAESASAQAQRPESKLPVGLGFEFKVGPYYPRMGDEDFPNEAFRISFGNYEDGQDGVPSLVEGPGTNPLFNLGTEVQVWRGFGSATVYGSVGFAKWTGAALDEETGRPTADDTTLNIVPLTLQAGYKADFIVERTAVPLVPYIRGGLAYTIYWVTDGSGSISEVSDEGTGEIYQGLGGKFGVVGTAGVALLLNFFDNRSTRALYNTTSIRGTYVFFEGVLSDVNGFGQDGFDFSDFTWNAGLQLEW